MKHSWKLTPFLLAYVILPVFAATKSKHLITLYEENWKDVLTGEWMLEFHAPWCPACRDLQKAWNSFADWSKDLNINVAEVDVTTNPGLSGRFLVTALPTIYHVKDGVFRQYVGPRDKNDFISFIEDKRWSLLDPVPSYKHPDSAQMGVVAVFFRLSMAVRDLHTHLVENVGIPPWASYTGFAAVTLTLGCILGFIIVCIIDYVFPTGTIARKAEEKKGQKKNQKASNTKKADEKESTSDNENNNNRSAESKNSPEAKKPDNKKNK
ncbi:thioredoxin domain-containing protein [Ditylenchus destructor]|uniref:Thioredoxin-related transmembrane protein 1 n=1 Tax=Ditylenchus destructor TaxID=166010 RepID=A0AAD4NDT9_9BILA|nr:thioredoxin domain-containing protein [Ditylenchus destructor]